MKTLKQIYWAIWLPICFVFIFTAGWFSSYHVNSPMEKENPLCKDEPHRTAWVAKRDSTYMCFQRWNQWPNKSYSSIIPYEEQNYYSTPFEFIQRELRFNFQEETYPDP